MSETQPGALDIKSKMKEAEVYFSMGLFEESLGVYEDIASDTSEIEPEDIKTVHEKIDALKEKIADSEKICPYIDLPIQHVSSPILKAMKRPYDEQKLRRLIDRLRSACPDIALRTTIMVGFPGETEQDIEQLLDFLADIRFHHLGVFCYSPEEGTAIFNQPDSIPQDEKDRRCHEVMNLQAAISLEIQKGFIDTFQEVVIEGRDMDDPELLRARTKYQAPEVDGVLRIKSDLVTPPAMAMASITHAETYDLKGKLFLKE